MKAPHLEHQEKEQEENGKCLPGSQAQAGPLVLCFSPACGFPGAGLAQSERSLPISASLLLLLEHLFPGC